jgi:hypothetical protein
LCSIRDLAIEVVDRVRRQAGELAQMSAADHCQAADQLARRDLAARAVEELVADGLGVAIGRLRPTDHELAHRGESGELDTGCVDE